MTSAAGNDDQGRGSRTPAVWWGLGAAAVALVVVGGLLAWLLLRGPEGPEDVVRGFFDDGADGDCPALAEKWHPDYLADTGFASGEEFCAEFPEPALRAQFEDMELDFRGTQIDGDEARVQITQTWPDGYSEDWTLILERLDGEWLLLDDELEG